MNIEQMKYLKQSKGYSLEKLSELSGVPRDTLQKIFSGETKNPRHQTLEALRKALTPPPLTYEDVLGQPKTDHVAEAASVYGAKKKGEYTLGDYYALPEDQRVELIDGEFFVMDAPSIPHQIVGGDLFVQISLYIRENKGNCIPLIAPADVQLDCDEKTMVQPDVMILCDRKKLINRCVMGAPDFIVEVLSKSTKKKDAFLKYYKYENAGVREYWMIDLKAKRVITYFFDNGDGDMIPTIYGANDEVPVRIYDGDLKISMKEIFEKIQDFEEE